MMSVFYISYAGLWLIVIFQGLVLLGVVRLIYRMNSHAEPDVPTQEGEGLTGQAIPTFTAIDDSGASFSADSLAGQMSALLFVTPDCTSCMASLAEVDALRGKVNGNLVVVCRAGLQECKHLRQTYNLDAVPVVVDETLEISKLFDVRVTPTAVLVTANGRIQSYGHPMDVKEFTELRTGLTRGRE
jgi:peroxiredoxin